MPTQVESVTNNVLLGVVSNEADRCTSLGDAVPAPRFTSAMGPGVARLRLSGSAGSLSPPINWVQVENNIEQVCLQVTSANRLLQRALAMVGRDILYLIQVSLKQKKKKVYLSPSSSLRVPLYPLASTSTVPSLRHC
jgi:hypothetical protein